MWSSDAEVRHSTDPITSQSSVSQSMLVVEDIWKITVLAVRQQVPYLVAAFSKFRNITYHGPATKFFQLAYTNHYSKIYFKTDYIGQIRQNEAVMRWFTMCLDGRKFWAQKWGKIQTLGCLKGILHA
jgi:hypothetical protein